MHNTSGEGWAQNKEVTKKNLPRDPERSMETLSEKERDEHGS